MILCKDIRSTTESTCGTANTTSSEGSRTTAAVPIIPDRHPCITTVEMPMQFPKPTLESAQWMRCTKTSESILVRDPITLDIFEASNVLYTTDDWNSLSPESGYWIRNTIKKALFGRVVRAVVLRRCCSHDGCEWELTDVECAIKVLSKSKIVHNRKKFGEDPMKEIAAMQYMKRCGRAQSHVLTPVEVLADSKYIFVVLPLCKGGELFDRLDMKGRFCEDESRHWFSQICRGISTLHHSGVCHRDLSLENILIHDDGSCHIIDMGMSLRVPQHREHTKCPRRVLISPQGRCGKVNYMSPEVYRNDESFDPQAIDVWSAGTILFMMLTGAPPFQRPCSSDPCFPWIASGQLSELLNAWGINGVSMEALDLLEGMLCVDSEKRYTLQQVINHPWMRNDFAH